MANKIKLGAEVKKIGLKWSIFQAEKSSFNERLGKKICEAG